MDKTWSGGGDTDSQVVNIGRHVSAWCWTSQSKGFKEKKRKERKEKAKLKLREELSWVSESRHKKTKQTNTVRQRQTVTERLTPRVRERERERGRAANLMNHMDMVLLSINSLYLFIFCQENENLIDWLILFYICLCLKVRKTIYKYI